MLKRTMIAVIAFFALSACQTSMVRSFEKVHPGMDKHQVLESLGNPNATSRLHGKDRWIYRFYDDNIRFDKEVHFLDGITVYVGDAWKPEADQTAEAKDKRNEELNEQVIVEQKQQAQKNREDFEKFQNEARNVDRVRYMPQFQALD